MGDGPESPHTAESLACWQGNTPGEILIPILFGPQLSPTPSVGLTAGIQGSSYGSTVALAAAQVAPWEYRHLLLAPQGAGREPLEPPRRRNCAAHGPSSVTAWSMGSWK